ncbi:MHS family MFS transporter [Microbacterium sp. EYE_5]|uniref:MFS transporter n=1 Tax=unclassified Microbacterium TaxID=2609290 RepID=UPI0020054982|nr:MULTISPECIES: MFS transporter [unclassified Microbacterium]MCK6080792.1 MHS family MFS transporter [Microbacterium sp. EYE_382]MCK6086063.1 MHS family MFS transporter [Microbacterium sp. EYE_384]MCK6124439.1 MHS family MFS transporter [Microbacterium sp. EYE_80]MCK6127348.1 MHS family MFS transporter [Microbacterium sp. EYE_79]MCK6141747.1 MHS family MFS transporter [Microbacterium sp. EYE_39]
MATDTSARPRTGAATTREERRVLAGTLVGTSIEWYDFFIYAQAAGLVLAPLFLAPLAESNPGAAQVLSFATIGISFLFRPLGAVVAGWLGDRIGRKKLLVFTLIMMGVSTSLIGVLPTYEAIGIAAPILLITLRILQGFSAGGEWGGAALLSVEHAPKGRRGFFGAFPQIGVPVGMILATGTLWILTSSMTPEAFLAWGWRVPFLLSIVLIVVGYIIRRAVEESPVFEDLLRRRKESSAPLGQLFRGNWREVALTAVVFIGNNAAGYLLIAFFSTYAVAALGMDRPTVLLATALASFGWLAFTLWGGRLSDRLGRVRTFQIGYIVLALWAVPMWFLIDTANILWYFVALFVMTFGLGLSYGPQAALYAELFPANVRYSGVSIGYALGAILGGAFAPMIAEALLNATGMSWTIGVYIAVVALISLVGVSLIKEPKDVDLHA